VDITRRGLKQNTKFDFLPRVDHPITPEIEFKIKNVTLVTLQNRDLGLCLMKNIT